MISLLPGASCQGRTRRAAECVILLVLVLVLALAACARPASPADDHELRVVTTTPVLADLVRQIGGEQVTVSSVIPNGADPHSYEPTLRETRDVVYADLALTNGLLLEEQHITKAVSANVAKGSELVAVAESIEQYGATLRPMVEDLSLDTVWLGARVRGSQVGSADSEGVRMVATGIEGPGRLVAYITGTFGQIDTLFDSDQRATDGSGAVDLPPDAHTHVSWAFTKKGIYRLNLQAHAGKNGPAFASGTVTFAVGVDPATAKKPVILDAGHADITADPAQGALYLWADPVGGGGASMQQLELEDVVIDVPPRALHELPPGPHYRFLGAAHDRLYQLAQAVLGKHVHGEIDPHVWHDVNNVKAMTGLIRDRLMALDPEHSAEYEQRAAAYLGELSELDQYVREQVQRIPATRRNLVTTHDSFGYFANAYGLQVAGFVTPTPGSEPSLQQRRKLVATIADLEVPAVFLEQNLIARSSVLDQVAAEQGVEVCRVYADSLDPDEPTYIAMMRANAKSIADCLSR